MVNQSDSPSVPSFYNETALLNKLSAFARNREKVVLVVGSPLTAPSSPDAPGVPGVHEMLQLIRSEYLDDQEATATFDQLLATDSTRLYQSAFEHLQGYRGQDVVNRVILKAVLRATQLGNHPAQSSMDEESCAKLEKDLTKWHISDSVQALGNILTRCDSFGQTLLTSNFDPLIEIGIRSIGGKAYRTVLDSDGSIDQTLDAEGCRVVHFHGYWYGADTLHTPTQLSQSRPRLTAALLQLFRSKKVVVLAYGGWDDVFTSALMAVVNDDRAKLDVSWAFFDDNEGKILQNSAAIIKKMQPGISRGRVTLYKGINVHSFCRKLSDKVSPQTAQVSAVPFANVEIVNNPAQRDLFEQQRHNDHQLMLTRVENLFSITGHVVASDNMATGGFVDLLAEEQHGLIRKKILIKCHATDSVLSPSRRDADIGQLLNARSKFGAATLCMYVCRGTYGIKDEEYANVHGVEICSLSELMHRLINFEPYIAAIRKDKLKKTILREYQPTTIHFEGEKKSSSLPAIDFLSEWLSGTQRWLTILGDYGVGKSWMLKRILYKLIEDYSENPFEKPLPLFVPLQRFTKAFTFQNLILAIFQSYGLTGIHYPAFEYLANQGRIVFLLDSFDEMAQTLRREVIRENLKELLTGITSGSKAIMTSRPTYFESRAERLMVVEQGGELIWHHADQSSIEHQNALSRYISDSLKTSRFARLNDLTVEQRKHLFSIVLKDKPKAHERLNQLYKRFHQLGSISQRAVIARLLTVVAETLANETDATTPDDYALLPPSLTELNQAKVFQIVVTNLLKRDNEIGQLQAIDRLRFLRTFAIYLQRPGISFFANPNEIKDLVANLFEGYLAATDTPIQLLENYYRSCRRHSGLTTEGQFLDTSGNIDTPIDERDLDSRVGFSHNSLREYLVADAIADYMIKGNSYPDLESVTITDVVGDLLVEISSYEPSLPGKFAESYATSPNSKMHELCFRIIYHFLRRDSARNLAMLGTPVRISDVDLCNLDLSGFDFSGAIIDGCIARDTDFRKSDLRRAKFRNCILDSVLFDECKLLDADFTSADITSIYVYDDFDRRTKSVLHGQDAKQWLYSHGAYVAGAESLNPHHGQPWYEAAREVTRTLASRIAGTHQDIGLIKGIKSADRDFAAKFVEYLRTCGILERVMKAGLDGGWVVKVNKDYRQDIIDFGEQGRIGDVLKPFFDKQLQKNVR